MGGKLGGEGRGGGRERRRGGDKGEGEVLR